MKISAIEYSSINTKKELASTILLDNSMCLFTYVQLCVCLCELEDISDSPLFHYTSIYDQDLMNSLVTGGNILNTLKNGLKIHIH